MASINRSFCTDFRSPLPGSQGYPTSVPCLSSSEIIKFLGLAPWNISNVPCLRKWLNVMSLVKTKESYHRSTSDWDYRHHSHSVSGKIVANWLFSHKCPLKRDRNLGGKFADEKDHLRTFRIQIWPINAQKKNRGPWEVPIGRLKRAPPHHQL